MQKINHNKRIKKRVLLSLIVAIVVIIALFVIVAISFKRDAVPQTEYAYNNLDEHVPGNSDSLDYEDISVLLIPLLKSNYYAENIKDFQI